MKNWRNAAAGAVLMTIIGGVLLALGLKSKPWDGQRDLRFAIVTDNEVGMVSISPQRRMVNVLKVNERAQVWVPKGGGWQEAAELKKIHQGRDTGSLLGETFFYNFGFSPEILIKLGQFDEWKDDGRMVNELGLLTWLRFRSMRGNMIVNTTEIKRNVDEEKGLLNEILARDFADSSLVNEEVRWSVYNTTNKSGFADFVASRLEWAGGTVTSVENSQEPIDKACTIHYSQEMELPKSFVEIQNKMGCEIVREEGVNSGEVELYLGENLAEVLKYLSYVRTL